MNYTLIKEENLEEIDSQGFLYEHRTGAKIVYIKNNDKNKVFSITFQTLAENDWGTAHILEHILLCGSSRYPVKDPFYELCKGSLYTYLNALTFKDKTMYPIASCNETDFYNLMDVYLDAVFNSLLKNRKETFLQEGWNYNVSEDNEVTGYGGIVYNEMKGVFSDPLEILEYFSNRALFGGTPFGFDAGGKPEEIPNLSYEKLIEFYEKNYRPENCYIYIYGDLDGKKCLDYIDKNYLSKYRINQNFKNIPMEAKSLKKPAYYTGKYIFDGEKPENKKYMSCSYVFFEKDFLDDKTNIAISVLKSYLIDMPSSLIKRMIIDNELAEDVKGQFDSTINTPTFTITAKNAGKTLEEFKKNLDEIFLKIVNDGIDEKLMKACLNRFEFMEKEDYRRYRPKGLDINFQIITDWIYKREPFSKLSKIKYLEELKNDMEYFLGLIEKQFIDNKWKAFVCIEPIKSLGMEKIVLKENLNINGIINENKKLENFQQTMDKKEDLEKIPLLELSEIDCSVEEIPLIEKEIEGVKALHCSLDAKGIGYVDFIFETRMVEQRNLPYIGLISYILNKMDTENYLLRDLTADTMEYLGGFNFFFKIFKLKNCQYKPTIILRTKALSENILKIFELALEVCKNTIFKDEKILKELIKELAIKLEKSILNEGQNLAISRLTSYMFESEECLQYVSGFEFYKFIKNISDNFEERKNDIFDVLEGLKKSIFNKNNLIFGITCSKEIFEDIKEGATYFIKNIGEFNSDCKIYNFGKNSKNEGIVTESLVQYVAKGWRLDGTVFSCHGKIAVLTNILDSAYLLQKVRLEGGAYGCYSKFDKQGSLIFYSYRDPNLLDTLDVYENFVKFLEELDLSKRELDKYILGTINKFLRPQHVSQKGYLAVERKIGEIGYDDLVKEIEEIISFNFDDLKMLIENLKSVYNQNYICAVGGADVLMNNTNIFDKMVNITS